MTDLDVTAAGAPRLIATAGAAADELRDLVDVHRDAGNLVLAGVRPPVYTGRLARTVRLDVTAHGFEVHAGGPAAPYAAIVHARNPFLARALTDRQSAVVDRYTGRAERAVADIRGA